LRVEGLRVSERDRITALQLGNAGAFAAVIVVNSLAGGTTLIGGRNTADVSAAFPTLITPAGFTFSIWGIIYALLAAFIIFQFLPKHRQGGFNKRVSYFFILSSLFNILWLFLWQYEYLTASVLLIFALLIALTIIYLRLDVGRSKATRGEKLWVHLPFSVYLGWITIASIADVSSALVSINWTGFGLSPSTWAQLVVVVALGVTLLVLGTRRDPAYGLVVVWALIGIASNQVGHAEVVLVTEVSAVVVAAATLVVLFLILTRLRMRAEGQVTTIVK
jgi:benzodiazapine receptor